MICSLMADKNDPNETEKKNRLGKIVSEPVATSVMFENDFN